MAVGYDFDDKQFGSLNMPLVIFPKIRYLAIYY